MRRLVDALAEVQPLLVLFVLTTAVVVLVRLLD